jgi:hypothetical protein
MLSQNIRGGLSFASQRYCESAVYQKLSGVDVELDEHQRFNVILDIDANNLYGTCQIFPLPYKNFEFISDEEKETIDWGSVNLTNDTGYFVEVSLDYPEEIWEKTKSYPLCPENIKINFDLLSPYQKDVLKLLYRKSTYNEKKLTCSFFPREKIVLHALNLQLYLKLGMTLKKVHRVVKFDQKPFMKNWVDFCTAKRSQSKNEFTRNFWKLIVNSVYGKTIESVANRKQVKIIRDLKTLSFYITKPTYDCHIIINENLIVMILNPESVRVDKPYYIGFTILELAKNIMYDFFYNVLRPYFGEKGVSLLYTDTDSLAIQIKTCDLLTDLKNLSSNMDFSNLNTLHPLFSPENKAQLFKFKEEFALRPISRFCALKSKVYSFESACTHNIGVGYNGRCLHCNNVCFTGKNFNRLKGVQKRTAKDVHFSKYLSCLSEIKAHRERVTQIISNKQKLYTNVVSKIGLSSFCDKRFIFNCGIHSEPYSTKNEPFCNICEM